jgi:hypothetical protein
MNRREHSHPFDFSNDVTFSRNVIRQSLVRTVSTPKGERFRRTLPPTFLFLQSSIVKEQTSQTRCHGPLRFSAPGPCRVSLTRLSLRFHKGELSCRQRRAALVVRRYIVVATSHCQHRFPTFLNFLRRCPGKPVGRWGNRCWRSRLFHFITRYRSPFSCR